MKSKNLIILLVMPFVIALVGIPLINTTFRTLDNEISSIEWDYDDIEAFKLSNKTYELHATAKYNSGVISKDSGMLVWKVANKNQNEENHCSLEKNVLTTLSEGEVVITVSNIKGSVFRSMSAVIYENGAIIASPVIQNSQSNIDQTIYYGEYDLVNGKKQKATIDYNVKVIPSSLTSALEVKSISNNISISNDYKTISVEEIGKASITFGFIDSNIGKDTTVSFDIVKDGVNVYDYETLMSCSANKGNGEIIVLRKSFESLDNTYNKLSNGNYDMSNTIKNNVVSFGNYDTKKKEYNFINEVYAFDTTSNSEYIDQWNNFTLTHKEYKPISKTVYAGLHINKDFYGNGYTINLHNLAYPYAVKEVNTSNGIITVASLTDKNLFRGPKPFYLLGNPNNMPLIGSYGQDNIGIYVEGDNITINDLNVKNCDFGNILSNLDYVGTVMEVYGNNITIKNSRLSNGKNVLRSFSSNNVLVDNCLLNYSRNFLLVAGNNEYIKAEDEISKSFLAMNENANDTLKKYLAKDGMGDQILNKYIQGDFEDKDKENLKASLLSIQDALYNSKVENIYKGDITINNSIFSHSGISSIALESYFNGPYLYSGSPTLITELFDTVSGMMGSSLVPYTATNISGSSYPVKVKLTGNTIFNDYKKLSNFDLSGLILENISTIINSLGYDYQIDIDDIFPLKNLLVNEARKKGLTKTKVVNDTSEEYISIPIAYYGGGKNLSTIDFSSLDNYDLLNHEIDIDFLDEFLDLVEGSSTFAQVKNMMVKCVTVVIGFDPFRFFIQQYDDRTFELSDYMDILINNAKGE